MPDPTPSADEKKRRKAQADFDKKMGPSPGKYVEPKKVDKRPALVRTLEKVGKAPGKALKAVRKLSPFQDGGVVPSQHSSGQMIMSGMQKMHAAEMEKHSKKMGK